MSDQKERTGQVLASYLWKQRNKEKVADQRRLWRLAHPAQHQEINARSRKANKAVANAKSLRYIANKKNANVAWADKSKIMEFYDTAQGLQMYTGDHYAVDHIVPLTSDIVCGLHWEANLQILTRAENSAKGNRVWPDMPQ